MDKNLNKKNKIILITIFGCLGIGGILLFVLGGNLMLYGILGGGDKPFAENMVYFGYALLCPVAIYMTSMIALIPLVLIPGKPNYSRIIYLLFALILIALITYYNFWVQGWMWQEGIVNKVFQVISVALEYVYYISVIALIFYSTFPDNKEIHHNENEDNPFFKKNILPLIMVVISMLLIYLTRSVCSLDIRWLTIVGRLFNYISLILPILYIKKNGLIYNFTFN